MALGAVAFITLVERKLLGLSHIRMGPNKVSASGILQPLADGVKLLIKQFFFVLSTQIILFYLMPVLLFTVFLLT